MDESAFRRLMAETKDKARDLAGQPHVSAEVKNLITNFFNITDNFDRALNSRVDMSGDARMLQKRFDVLKTEHNEVKKRLEKVSDTLMSEMGPILKSISADASAIDAQAEKLDDGTLKQAAANIKSSLVKFVETLKKL